MSGNIDTSNDHDDIMYPFALPFILLHASSFAAFWTGITWQAVAICVTLYWLRMFAITAGYHRYFSHRAYSTSRLFQFVLAFLAQSTAQKERAVVGGQTPPPSFAFRYSRGRAFAAAQGLLLQPCRVDFLPAA